MEHLTTAFETKLSLEEAKVAPPELGISQGDSGLKVWNVIDLYFRERGLVYHKLEPYDIFLETVKDVVRSAPAITVEDRKSQGIYQYTFGNASFIPPAITPQEARLRNMNYNVTLVVDIIQGFTNTLKTTTQKVYHNQKICELPLMIKSRMCRLYGKTNKEILEMGECDQDIGGYYLVNGKERCIVAQERIEYNRIYVWTPQKPVEKKNYRMMAEIRSVVVRGTKPATTKIFIEPSLNVICQIPSLKEAIQVGTIIHACGAICGTWDIAADSSEQIRQMICGDDDDCELVEIVEIILYNSHNSRNESCIDQIGSLANASIAKEQRNEFVTQMLRDEILLHIPVEVKPFFLAYMVRRMINVFLHRQPEDDRDHFANKRCDTDGKLLEDLFRGFFAKYCEILTGKLESHPNNVNLFEREFVITQEIHRCMSTGNWGIQKIGFQKVGVCQLLTRLNYTSALSHMRRVSSNRSVESRATRLRELHSSQWGIFDPAETPEGANSGILKNLSVAGHLTSSTSEDPVRAVLTKFSEFDGKISFKNCNSPKVFLNGSWIGTTDKPGLIVAKLRDYRSKGLLHYDTSIAYKTGDRELHIYCDAGRCSRPLFVVKGGKLVITVEQTLNPQSWHELVSKGCIQYVDTTEEQTSLISTWANDLLPKSNYCEIHPAFLLGVCCSIIPWPNCNQGPRNAYSGNMTKQSIGVYCSNFLQRFDTSAYILHYPQRPLTVPRMSKYFAYNSLPCGINAIVAIMCYTGFGQEDSVILNQGAVDRGLFAITVYKTYTAEELNRENQTIETIESPVGIPNEKGVDKAKNYLKLDSQGIIREKSIVNEGDVIIRKTIRRDGKNSERQDASVVHKIEETGFVDKVYITKNEEGNKLVKVRVGFIRLPILGDKFASRHAQKGTCGIILPEVDMPFTSQGIRPDIIINPHAIPSRMTIAHLIECVTNKKAALTGEFQDATPFAEAEGQMVRHIEQVGTALHSHGFHSRGEEAMYSGMTGERLAGTVFIGPTYYQRLKHMTMDKLSARATGPIQNFTRQPANHGRKNGTRYTSIKMGTMESDAMESQGAGQSVRERLLLSSDKYQTQVCDSCGMFCAGKGCKCEAGSTEVVMPYAFKLFHHNITALQIRASIRTESSTISLPDAEESDDN